MKIYRSKLMRVINFIKNKEDIYNIYIYITNKIILDFLKTALVNSNSKNIHIIKEKLNEKGI